MRSGRLIPGGPHQPPGGLIAWSGAGTRYVGWPVGTTFRIQGLLALGCHSMTLAILWRLVAALNRVLPKRGDSVVVCTSPDFDDTARAILPHLIGAFDRVVVLATSPDPISSWPGVQIIPHRSARGIWNYLRSRHVFFSHGLYGSRRPPNTQTVVNLWHGMPIKRIGLEAGQTPPQFTLAVATSPEFATILGRSWGVPPSTILQTGQPRTDRLLTADAPKIRNRLAARLGDFDRLIVWLPTFRQVQNNSQPDGIEFGNVFEFPKVNLVDLNSRLTAANALLLVKPHPLSIARDAPIDSLSRLERIDQEWLEDQKLTLYELLAATDFLISDLSSVWIDYLLLNRPILFAIADLEAFAESRGVSFLPVEEVLPGVLAEDYRQLVDGLESLLEGQDGYEDFRRTIAKRFHVHQDAGSTRRLLDALAIPYQA